MEKVFDPLRRKEVPLTPEEKVRQNFIAYLHNEGGIPFVRMSSEWSFVYNGRRYRADIVVFDRNLNPDILVECKAPSVTIDAAVIEQAIRYARQLKPRIIALTNGKVTYGFVLDPSGTNYTPTGNLF